MFIFLTARISQPQKVEHRTMLDLSSILVLLGVFLISLLLTRWLREGKKYPPAPWGFPIVGHLPLFGAYPPTTLRKWRQSYGDVYSIRMGSWKTVVINGYSAIKDAMNRSDDAFSSRPRFFTFEMLKKVNDEHDTIAFGPFNLAYVQLQKIIAKVLHKYTNTYMSFTQDLIQEEAETLCNHFLSWKGTPRYVNDAVQLSIGSILYQLLYGRQHNVREDKQFKARVNSANAFSNFSGSGNPLDAMPWLRYVMPWKVSTLYHLLKESANIGHQNVLDHVDSFSETHIRDITDEFLATELPDKVEDETISVSKSLLLWNVNNLAGAGFETTATMMNWLITYVVAFPEVQSRVQSEIDDVVGSSRRIDLNDRSKLCYTEATILEVMRITSAVPFSTPRFTTKDTKLNGFDIDKGTVILPNLHSVNMDKEFWKNPELFLPERLLNNKGNLDVDKCNHVLQFGMGRRRCVGEQFARLELFLLFSNVMQRCRFNKAHPGPVDLTQMRGLIYKSMDIEVIVTAR